MGDDESYEEIESDEIVRSKYAYEGDYLNARVLKTAFKLIELGEEQWILDIYKSTVKILKP